MIPRKREGTEYPDISFLLILDLGLLTPIVLAPSEAAVPGAKVRHSVKINSRAQRQRMTDHQHRCVKQEIRQNLKDNE